MEKGCHFRKGSRKFSRRGNTPLKTKYFVRDLLALECKGKAPEIGLCQLRWSPMNVRVVC